MPQALASSKPAIGVDELFTTVAVVVLARIVGQPSKEGIKDARGIGGEKMGRIVVDS